MRSSVYNLPAELGTFNFATIQNVLLPLRDPVEAFLKVASQATETLVVSEVEPYGESRKKTLPRWLSRKEPLLQFMPRATGLANQHTWWHLSPPLIVELAPIAESTKSKTRFHTLHFINGPKVKGYTVVSERE